MAIPEFNEEGLLPTAAVFADLDGDPVHSGHACTTEETESRFVSRYPNSTTRPALYQYVRSLTRLTKSHGLECVLIIVSGAFITDQEDPQDVYVILDVLGEVLDKLDGDSAFALNLTFNAGEHRFGEDSELTLQTGIIRAYPPGHRKFDMGHQERLVQRHMASEPLPGRQGGYLEILECEGGLNKLDEILRPPT